jgi:hypothetical protein
MADLDQIGIENETEQKRKTALEMSLLLSMLSASAAKGENPGNQEVYVETLSKSFEQLLNSLGYEIVAKADASA